MLQGVGFINESNQSTLEKLKKRFDKQTDKIRKYKEDKPKLSDYSAVCGFITFATLKSKHRYLKTYYDSLGVKSSPLDDKYKMESSPIRFQVAQDPRDIDYRFYNNSRPCLRTSLLILAILLVALVPTVLVLLLSSGVTAPEIQFCMNNEQMYKTISQFSNDSNTVECLCGFDWSSSSCDSYNSGKTKYYGLILLLAILVVGSNSGLRWLIERSSRFIRSPSR